MVVQFLSNTGISTRFLREQSILLVLYVLQAKVVPDRSSDRGSVSTMIPYVHRNAQMHEMIRFCAAILKTGAMYSHHRNNEIHVRSLHTVLNGCIICGFTKMKLIFPRERLIKLLQNKTTLYLYQVINSHTLILFEV